MVSLLTTEQMKEDGLTWMKSLYATESEVTGGEFCDDLVDDMSEFFEKDIDKTVVMNAIQRFRDWDCEDDEEQAYQLKVSGWQYTSGDRVETGARIGTIVNRELQLDKDIVPEGRQYAR